MIKEDWVEVELSDVCEKAVNVKIKEVPLSATIKYFDIGGIDNISNKIIGYKEYTWENAPSRAQQIIKKGDVLFSTVRTYLKNIALVDKDEYENEICSSGFTVLRGLSGILESKYLFYFSLSISFLNSLSKLQTGTSYPAVRDKDVFAQSIPLPPLSIQRAIVTKIKTLFISLDKGITDLRKAQEQLKIYRQAVLKKAFEGGFSKGRMHCASTEKEKTDLPKGWKWVQLGEVCETVKKVKRIEFKENDSFIYLDIGGIDNNTNKIVNHKAYRWKDAPSRAQQIVKMGDVLFSTVRTYLKNIAKVENIIYENQICSTGFTVIRGKKDLLDSKYIYYYTLSEQFLQPLNELQTGTSYPAVRDKDVFSQFIPLIPTLAEQHAIIREIESRLSVCDKVEQNIAEALEKAEALRQSILKRAFEGKLLSDAEIEKCKQAADYEPAEQLLKKIKEQDIKDSQASSKDVKRKEKKEKQQKISTNIHAGVIAKIIKLHEDNPEYLNKLSHVKCEKIAHLTEYYIEIPLGRKPVKDAAGPDDYKHLMKVEHRAKMAGYFNAHHLSVGHTYTSGRNLNKAIDKLEAQLQDEKKDKLNSLINLFLKMDLEQAEIIATLYAGWNNLLLDGKSPTDDEIVYESRENWSERKLTIDRNRFYNALVWMRKDNIALVPKGNGEKVEKPQKKNKK